MIDESDEHVFTDPATFLKFTKKAPCICLTATCADDAAESIERVVLQNMNFRIFENLVGEKFAEAQNPQFERVKLTTLTSMHDFIEKESTRNAVLLYCTPEFRSYLEGQCEYTKYIDDQVDLDMLRNLDQQSGGRFMVLVADNPDIALRGVDYRSYSNGITFITTRPFQHHREMVQAANRVGRGDDKYRRIVLGDADLIDHLASCTYKGRLVNFINAI